ncbi:MAG: SpoIIIAH-like family protein [bacterium]
MIKKNKLSIFLLAVVMMLSVYYINMPNETTTPTTSPSIVTKHPEFATKRLEILETREELVVEFENVLASADTSNTDKNEAYLSMQEVLQLTENEILLETFIMDLGYLDCLVQYEDDLLLVYVLNYVHTTQSFVEVSMITSSVFENDTQVRIITVSN